MAERNITHSVIVQHRRIENSGVTPKNGSIKEGELLLNVVPGEEKIYLANTNNQAIDFVSKEGTRSLITNETEGLRNSINDLGNRINALTEHVDTNIERVDADIDGITTQLNTAEEAISGHTEALQTTEAFLGNLIDRMNRAESNISTNANNISANTEKTEILSGVSADLRVRMDAVESSVNTLEDSVTANTASITSLNTSLESVSGDVITNRTNITNTHNTVTGLTADVSQLSTQLSETKTSVATNTSSIESMGNQITSINASQDVIKSNIQTLSGVTTVHAQSITDIEGDITELSGKTTTLRSDTDVNTTSISSINAQVTSINENIDSLGNRATALETADTEIREQISLLQETDVALRNDIDTVSGNVKTVTTTVSNHTRQLRTLQTDLDQVATTDQNGRVKLGVADADNKYILPLQTNEDEQAFVDASNLYLSKMTYEFDEIVNKTQNEQPSGHTSGYIVWDMTDGKFKELILPDTGAGWTWADYGTYNSIKYDSFFCLRESKNDIYLIYPYFDTSALAKILTAPYSYKIDWYSDFKQGYHDINNNNPKNVNANKYHQYLDINEYKNNGLSTWDFTYLTSSDFHLPYNEIKIVITNYLDKTITIKTPPTTSQYFSAQPINSYPTVTLTQNKMCTITVTEIGGLGLRFVEVFK